MRLRNLLIILMLLFSLTGAYYVNKWLLKSIAPRRSFSRFLLYMLVSLVLVFLYTFLLVLIISNLFPLPKR